MHKPDPDTTADQFWERHYAERDQIWSGQPNARLVKEVADMAPGTALELGCGEGADAIWLAQQGWSVLATDIAETALARGRRAAEDNGVADRIEWQAHDLAETFPEGVFDLVCASYLLSPVPIPREGSGRAAASAVAPGGTLLILSHTGFPPWVDADPSVDFPSPQQELAALTLNDHWTVECAQMFARDMVDPDGNTVPRVDTILRVRREDIAG